MGVENITSVAIIRPTYAIVLTPVNPNVMWLHVSDRCDLHYGSSWELNMGLSGFQFMEEKG